MGATLLDGVVMEPGSIVAAGAVVAPGGLTTPLGTCLRSPQGGVACYAACTYTGGFVRPIGQGWRAVWFCAVRAPIRCRRPHREKQAVCAGTVGLAVLTPVSCTHACTTGTTVKTGEIWAGVPAKVLRHLSADEKGFVAASAENYARIAMEHR